MTAPRRNIVALLSQHAPKTIGWLEIPLTPSRAARLADFCARTGLDAQSLVVDLLDDVIFNIAPPCAPDVGTSPNFVGRYGNE